MGLVLCNDIGEESAQFLAESLNIPLVNYNKNVIIETNRNDWIFKYGVSAPIKVKKGVKVFNKRKPTLIAIDKLKAFEAFQEFDFIPEFTTEPEVALGWLDEDEHVVVRTQLKGNNGKGTYIFSKDDPPKNVKEPSKLITKYIHHTDEIRVCCWRNTVLSVYEKVIRDDNFTFKLWKEVENQPQLIDLVEKIYSKIPLDFYGLDIVRDNDGKLWVLEINSAPILFPYTCKKLVDEIRKEIA